VFAAGTLRQNLLEAAYNAPSVPLARVRKGRKMKERRKKDREEK